MPPLKAHSTPTSEDAWDGPANEARLPSPLPVSKAREAYAWLDESEIEDDESTDDED